MGFARGYRVLGSRIRRRFGRFCGVGCRYGCLGIGLAAWSFFGGVVGC